jgi:hypothetical protein
MINWLGVLAVVLCFTTSLTLVISRNWRWSIGALAVQYIGVFLLVMTHWSIGMAVTKLLVGWMAGAVLGSSQMDRENEVEEEEQSWPAGRLFRLLASGIVLVAIFSLSMRTLTWLPGVGLASIWGGLTLIGMGLLQLGITAQPFRVILGLLTLLSGFEIIYAAIEFSLLVTGLLAVINLGLALIGVFWLNSSRMEINE